MDMVKISGIYRNREQADRVLEALDEMGIDQDALSTFSRPRVEVEKMDEETPDEILVTAYVQDEKKDEVETIFKNSDATQVNVWDKDWQPTTTWSPIVFARPSNA
jgi:hypothetical protein